MNEKGIKVYGRRNGKLMRSNRIHMCTSISRYHKKNSSNRCNNWSNIVAICVFFTLFNDDMEGLRDTCLKFRRNEKQTFMKAKSIITIERTKVYSKKSMRIVNE